MSSWLPHLSKLLTGERQAFGTPSYLSCKVMSCTTSAPLTIFQDSQCLICIANNGREVLLLTSQRPELTILKGWCLHVVLGAICGRVPCLVSGERLWGWSTCTAGTKVQDLSLAHVCLWLPFLRFWVWAFGFYLIFPIIMQLAHILWCMLFFLMKQTYP